MCVLQLLSRYILVSHNERPLRRDSFHDIPNGVKHDPVGLAAHDWLSARGGPDSCDDGTASWQGAAFANGKHGVFVQCLQERVVAKLVALTRLQSGDQKDAFLIT